MVAWWREQEDRHDTLRNHCCHTAKYVRTIDQEPLSLARSKTSKMKASGVFIGTLVVLLLPCTRAEDPEIYMNAVSRSQLAEPAFSKNIITAFSC